MPDRIYNLDKMNITVNCKGHSSILALKGCHPVGVVGSSEKGGTVREVICFYASGSFMPPMLIFPRKRMHQDFQLNLPSRAWVEVYETGWMTKPLFCTWL
jgi:DDE superfamily endonuclease.